MASMKEKEDPESVIGAELTDVTINDDDHYGGTLGSEIKRRKPPHHKEEETNHAGHASNDNIIEPKYELACSMIEYYVRLTKNDKSTIQSPQNLYVNTIYIPLCQNDHGIYYIPSDHPFKCILLENDAFDFGGVEVVKTKILQTSPTPLLMVDRLIVRAVADYIYDLLLEYELVNPVYTPTPTQSPATTGESYDEKHHQ